MRINQSIRRILYSVLAITALTTASPINAADYPSAVLSDNPLVYYRLADTPPVDVAKNSGSLGAVGNGIHGPGVVHRTAGALTANGNASAGYDLDLTGTTHTFVPYLPALNPASGSPFTIEFWT